LKTQNQKTGELAAGWRPGARRHPESAFCLCLWRGARGAGRQYVYIYVLFAFSERVREKM
jgi:hypothetical protein